MLGSLPLSRLRGLFQLGDMRFQRALKPNHSIDDVILDFLPVFFGRTPSSRITRVPDAGSTSPFEALPTQRPLKRGLDDVSARAQLIEDSLIFLLGILSAIDVQLSAAFNLCHDIVVVQPSEARTCSNPRVLARRNMSMQLRLLGGPLD